MAKVLDKIKGIFSEVSGEKQDSTNPNTPEQQQMWDTVNEDYQVFKAARQPVERHWRKEQRFYMGDHWHGLRTEAVSKRRPDAVENVAFSQIEAIVGKLAGWMPYPDYSAPEPGDERKAQDLNDYMPYELRKINFKQKHLRAVRRMVIHGPLVYKTIFDPTVEGGRGQNRYTGRNDILPVDLATFFPDPRINDFIYLQQMSAVIIHTRQPLEYFRKRWPEQGRKVQPDNGSSDVDIFNNDVQDSRSFNHDTSIGSNHVTDKTSGLIEYWYRGLPKMVTEEDKEIFSEQADEMLQRGVDPSELVAKAAGQMEGVHCIYISTSGVFLEHKSYVYDHGQYPFVARTLYPEEGSAWGKGFMRDMIKPQIMKNKYAEIAVETSAKQGGSAIMYEEGVITKPRTWQEQRGLPGAMLPVAPGRLNGVKELQGVNAPATVFNALDYYDKMLQKIPGQFDSANGQASSNVTSGEQAKALMAAAGTRLNTASDMIQEALEEVFAQYVELIVQFYTTERIARVTGRKVSISREAIVSRVPSEFQTGNVITDPVTGEELPEKLPVEEEFTPEFDILVNISVDKPQDREYWLQLVFNLLNMRDPITQLPMVDAEAVRFVIQTGRMESMDVIKRRIEEAAGMQQQFMQAQQQAQQLSQENQQLQQTVTQMQGQQQQQDTQAKAFDQDLQQQKMNLEAAKVAHTLMGQNTVGR
ncbi:portal protein [Paenibacillus sp. T2-29]